MNTKKFCIMIVGLSDDKFREIERTTPDAEYIRVSDNADEIRAKASGINALIGCPRNVFSDDLLLHIGPELKWVHSGGAGIEDYITPGLINGPAEMTNGKILQGPEIADHAFGLLLALTRNIALALRGTKNALDQRPIELRGKNALVIGTGGIGILIAERARAFGMKVYGLDANYVPMLGFFENNYLPEDLHLALSQADVVFMASPHTNITDKLIGKQEFSSMKKGTYFINVSRGKIVDTEALVNSLESNHLAGAGLDVTEPEPLPENHILRTMSNVVITPHIAGLSENNRERSFTLMKQNIHRFVNGKPLLNIVNKNLGF